MEPQRLAYQGDYIGGHFLKVSESNGEIFSQDPGNLDRRPIPIPYRYDHVEESAGAAHQAFATWRNMPASDRFAAILRYSEQLRKRKDQIALCVSSEMGKPLWEAQQELDQTLVLIDYFLKLGSHTAASAPVAFENSQFTGNIRSNSLGVVAVFGSPDMPVLFNHQLFIPALIHGNTVLFKPSIFTPLSGQCLAEAFHDASFPSGVFNLVQGNDELSRRLCGSRQVNSILFTGSFETSVKLKKELVSHFWKKVVLHLGGRNALTIWKDAPYEKAIYDTIFSGFVTSGQRQSSLGSVFVHDSIFDKVVEDLHRLAKKCSVGYGPQANAAFLGPLFSERTMENYLAHQSIAVREGCEEIMRGKALERAERGHYVTPSIHIVVSPDKSSIYQKEPLFGPNIALYRVRAVEEISEVMRMTQYGFVASFYSKDRESFSRFMDAVPVGHCYWNIPTTAPAYEIPYGGIQKSGNFHPMGSWSHLQCTWPKSSIEDEQATMNIPAAMPKL